MPESETDALASRMRVGVIGAGAVGNALLMALAARGASVGLTAEAVASRDLAHAQAAAARAPGCVALAADALDALAARCDLIFIATSDDAIRTVAERVAWRPGQAVAHLSGAHGVTPLAAAAARGALVAALHPLMTFPRVPLDAAQTLARFAGTTWALECDDAALAARLSVFVTALDGRVIRLAEADRAPYHLSGVLASNYLVTLAGAAADLWAGWGVERADALRALLPLLRATVDNLEAVGLPAALTGPIARGDVGAVRIHEAWLRTHAEAAPDGQALRAAYDALARLTLPLAREKGALSDSAADALRRALDEE